MWRRVRRGLLRWRSGVPGREDAIRFEISESDRGWVAQQDGLDGRIGRIGKREALTARGECLCRHYCPGLGRQAVFLEAAVGFIRNGALNKFPAQELFDGFLEIAAALRMTETFQ